MTKFEDLKINRKYKIHQSGTGSLYDVCRLLKVGDYDGYPSEPQKILRFKFISSSDSRTKCWTYMHEKGTVGTFARTESQLDKFELIND